MVVAQRRQFSFVFATALLFVACSGNTQRNKKDDLSGSPTGGTQSGGSSTTSGSPYCDPTPILVRSCAGVACHGKPGEPAQFSTDLLNPAAGQTLGQSLLGKPANYDLVVDTAMSCPRETPELLIDPSVPAESLILKKIRGTQKCGLTMPNTTRASAMLTQDDIACLVDWVEGVITESGGTVTSNAAATTLTTSSGTTTAGTTTAGVTDAGTTSVLGTTTGTTGTGMATTSTNGGAQVPATFDTVITVLTTNQISCIGSDCHGGVDTRIDLRPDEMRPAEMLYNRLTTQMSELCGKLIVSPGYPDQSALVQVLTTGCGTVTPGCLIGTECIPRMPLECTEGVDCIPPDYIEAIRQWIANGAPLQ